jgi:hypothetical protein
MVEKQEDLMHIFLHCDERTGHLPQLLRDVIVRLRLDLSTKATISTAAGHHGKVRRKQCYTVPMMVEESRLLQVCLFGTLHKSASQLDFSKLLPDIVTIGYPTQAADGVLYGGQRSLKIN